MFDFLTQNRKLKEQNMTLKADLEWNKFLYTEADGLNSILKKVLVKKNNKIADLEKRVADLEEQLAKKVFLLDDEGTPIKSFTLTGKLTFMDEPAEEKLEVGKWYDARTFEVEKLKELLPVGTQVAIIPNSQVDEAEVINEEEDNHITRVSKIVEEFDITKGRKQTVVYADIYEFVPNNWFKITEEN